MANTRQQIVDAIETRFSALPSIEKVAVWRASSLPVDQLPAVLIRDTVDTMPTDGIGTGRRDHDLQVEITCMFSGSTSVADARELAAELVTSIGTDPTWSALAFDTILTSVDLNLEDANQLISAAQIEISIRYRTELWSI